MSGSAIADGFKTLLSATSVLGSGNVSINSYQVLESSACACAVIQWTRLASTPVAFGSPRARDRLWDFQIRAFIRDTGDPLTALNRVWTATNTIMTAIEDDDTVQGTCEVLNNIVAIRDPETAMTFGGHTWLPITITATVTEFV